MMFVTLCANMPAGLSPVSVEVVVRSRTERVNPDPELRVKLSKWKIFDFDAKTTLLRPPDEPYFSVTAPKKLGRFEIEKISFSITKRSKFLVHCLEMWL